MTYKKFYQGKLPPHLLERIDAEHKAKMSLLVQKTEHGNWTEKQRKRQKSSILPNIALYQTFLENGIPPEKAKALVRAYSFYKAEKFHGILETLFYLPGFFQLFRFFMRTGMKGREIWISKLRTDNTAEYSMDVLKCLWADTCAAFGCSEICEIFCLCDFIVFGNIKQMQFKRSQTLGMGGGKCDFCFRSKKPKHP